MQAFILSYTKAINKRYHRCGSIFQGRFQVILVDSDGYRLRLSRYIHLNPVKSGLVKCPEDWEFSSYADYAGFRQGTLPKMENLLKQVGSADAYQHFVNAEHTKALKSLMLD